MNNKLQYCIELNGVKLLYKIVKHKKLTCYPIVIYILISSSTFRHSRTLDLLLFASREHNQLSRPMAKSRFSLLITLLSHINVHKAIQNGKKVTN